jgi:hypothetical protein
MADFNKGTVLTDAGVDMQAEVQAGDRLVYTHGVIGQSEIARFNHLERLKHIPGKAMRAKVVSAEALGDGTAKVRLAFDNRQVRDGFWLRSIGLYARVDHGGVRGAAHEILEDWRDEYDNFDDTDVVRSIVDRLINPPLKPFFFPHLYAVAYAGQHPDFVPAYNGQTTIEHVIDVIVIVGRAKTVAASISVDSVVPQAHKPWAKYRDHGQPGERIDVEIQNYDRGHSYLVGTTDGTVVNQHGSHFQVQLPLSPRHRVVDFWLQSWLEGFTPSSRFEGHIRIDRYIDTVAKPEPLWPREGRGVARRALLVGGPYHGRGLLNNYLRSKWLVAADPGFEDIVLKDQTILPREHVRHVRLFGEQSYFWKMAYRGRHGLWSDWSDQRMFFVKNHLFDLTPHRGAAGNIIGAIFYPILFIIGLLLLISFILLSPVIYNIYSVLIFIVLGLIGLAAFIFGTIGSLVPILGFFAIGIQNITFVFIVVLSAIIPPYGIIGSLVGAVTAFLVLTPSGVALFLALGGIITWPITTLVNIFVFLVMLISLFSFNSLF